LKENNLADKTITIFVKNMVCNCCIRVIREEFEKAGLKIEKIELGSVVLNTSKGTPNKKKIREILNRVGFDIIIERELQIVEKTKLAVIELIHQLNNVDSIIRKSDYIVEKLGMSYQHISKIFSQNESITLERYIILHKIERIKELVLTDEFTLSEITFMMDYSSVQHLSAQFKQITGFTVSEFKSGGFPKIPLNELY
jgi:AraC family transcriptional regulator